MPRSTDREFLARQDLDLFEQLLLLGEKEPAFVS